MKEDGPQEAFPFLRLTDAQLSQDLCHWLLCLAAIWRTSLLAEEHQLLLRSCITSPGMSNHLKPQQLDWDSGSDEGSLARKGTESRVSGLTGGESADGDTQPRLQASQTHQHVGAFIGYIRLQSRLPMHAACWWLTSHRKMQGITEQRFS